MAVYTVNNGDIPMASDVNQSSMIFNGTHDIGQVTLAPILAAPTSSSFSLSAQSGSTLGVGAYNYQFTYITGQYKSNNTLSQSGESLVSGSVSLTTTTNNTTIKITLPTTNLPPSVIAFSIYRTSAGGSDYKLIATVKTGNAYYVDSTADGSRGSQGPPTTNTTGTVLRVMAQPASIASILGQSSLAAGVETILTYQVTNMNNSGVFYAPYTGLYLFNVSLFTNITGSGSYCQLNYSVNGTFRNAIGKIVNGGSSLIDVLVQGTALVSMNANDQVYFSAINSSGGNINTANSVLSYVKVT